VGHQHVETQQQNQHGGAVLQVPVQLSDDPAQPQQPDHFQGTEQAPDALQSRTKKRSFQFKILCL